MNPEALRKKRLEEIEQKRKRLEEMKKSRSSQDSVPSSTPLPQTSSPLSSEASVNDSAQSLLKTVDLDEKNDTNLLISKLLQENGSRRIQPDKAKQFSVVKSSSCFTFMPKEIVKYDKECQFDCDDCFETTHVEKREDIEVNNYATHDSNKNRKFNNYESKCDSTSFSHKNVLSEEEKSLLQKDARFLHFFHAACLKIERALEFEEKFDIFKNYSMDTEIQSSVDSSQNSFEQVCTYSELSLLGRPIMELRWSPFVADLFLVAYGAKDSATIVLESNRGEEDKDDHFGAVCLWSRDMHTRPERKFVTSSPVLTVMFHPTEVHYIVGGCENGQVVLWDLKELKLTPVQRSNLTGKGHKHPVCGLSSITTGSAACEIVSISVDGMLCHWDMARMNDPIVTLQLSVWNQNLNSQVQGSKDMTTIFSSPIRAKAGMYNTSKEGSSLNISCFTVGQGHQNQFIVVGNGVGDLFKSEYPFKTGMVSQQVMFNVLFIFAFLFF
jgi:WD40 repeat protein